MSLLAAAVVGMVVGLGQEPSSGVVARELTFGDGRFTLKGPEGVEVVPVSATGPAMNVSAGRLWIPVAGKVVSFDAEGLAVRSGGRRSVTTFTSVATSRDLMSQEEADAVNRAVAAGERTLDVNGVSGWEVVGEVVYLLLRWETTARSPWLEALVSIDLGEQRPQARLHGSFSGFTGASGRVADRLVHENGVMMAMTRTSEGLQVASFDIRGRVFSTRPLVGGMFGQYVSGTLVGGSDKGVVFHRTPAGTLMVGLADRSRGTLRQVNEVRGSVLGVHAPALLHYARGEHRVLLNLESGAEVVVPRDLGLRSVSAGVLLWTPAGAPRSGAVYSLGSFRTLARWRAGG